MLFLIITKLWFSYSLAMGEKASYYVIKKALEKIRVKCAKFIGNIFERKALKSKLKKH